MDDSSVSDWNAELRRRREKERALGDVRGRHYTEWVQDITQLLRRRDGDAALALLLECAIATSTETVAGAVIPAPWYTERAAIIYHRRKNYIAEAALLREYLAGAPGVRAPMRERLHKAEALISAAANADVPPTCPKCGSVLENWPDPRSECPACGSELVKRQVSGFPKVFTGYDDERRPAATLYRRQRRAMLKRLGPANVTEEMWDAKETVLEDGNVGDVYWSLATEAVERASKDNNWVREYSTLFDMAKFRVESGLDWLEYASAAENVYRENLLSHYSDNTLLYLYGCGCATCRANQGTVTVGEYLNEQPTPHPDCETPPCFCSLRQPQSFLP
ncbi:MAG: hypothetical protein EPN48_07850 [Microbacteriaceae bacterium]|nr:MAG: hypothetical protein EPN48_07850 [Microbacteriaceae bacterium]